MKTNERTANILNRMASEKKQEREEKEKRETEEREQEESALRGIVCRIRGEEPAETATEEKPDFSGPGSWNTAEDAEAEENIRNFLDNIRK